MQVNPNGKRISHLRHILRHGGNGVSGANGTDNGLVSRRDIAKLKRIRNRQRILRVALGVVSGVAAFVLGGVTREVVTGATTYPYAAGAAAAVGGAGLRSMSIPEKRLFLVVFGVLSAVMFTLGVLLTAGHTESTSSIGEAPMYGVFHP